MDSGRILLSLVIPLGLYLKRNEDPLKYFFKNGNAVANFLLKISGTELEGAILSGEGSNPGVRQESDSRVVAAQMERSKCTTDRAPEYKVMELDWL